MRPALCILLSLTLSAQTGTMRVQRRAAAPSGITLIDHKAGAVTTAAMNNTGANFLVMVAVTYGGASVSCGDSSSNSWTALTEYIGTNAHVQVYYAKNATVTASQTVACSSSNFVKVFAASFSLVNTTSPFDLEAGAFGSGATLQPGSITPSVNGELIISGFANVGSNTFSIDSGMTILDQSPLVGGTSQGGGLAYKVQGTAAAINPTWSNTGSVDSAASIAGFKP